MGGELGMPILVCQLHYLMLRFFFSSVVLELVKLNIY